MKYILLLLFILAFTLFVGEIHIEPNTAIGNIESVYDFGECERWYSANSTFLRCENREVVCYVLSDYAGYGGQGGLSCKYK